MITPRSPALEYDIVSTMENSQFLNSPAVLINACCMSTFMISRFVGYRRRKESEHIAVGRQESKAKCSLESISL